MQITQNQIEALKGKCDVFWKLEDTKTGHHPYSCVCQGTGKPIS